MDRKQDIAKQLEFSSPEEKEVDDGKQKRVGPLRQSSRIKLEKAARKAKEEEMKNASRSGGEKLDDHHEPVASDDRKVHEEDGKGGEVSNEVPDSGPRGGSC